MFKKLLVLFGFTLLLSGCGSPEKSVLEDYKKAIINEDSEALKKLVTMKDEDLTPEEAEGYIALVNDNYTEEELDEELNKFLEKFEDGSSKTQDLKATKQNYALATFKIEDDGPKVIIPRYPVGAEYPPGFYPIKFGTIEVDNLTDTVQFKSIGEMVPAITEYKGTATEYSGNATYDGKEFPFKLKINFNNPVDDRVTVEL